MKYLTEQSDMSHVALELNNLGVALHECNDLTGASTFFRDALHFMTDLIHIRQGNCIPMEPVSFWNNHLDFLRAEVASRRTQRASPQRRNARDPQLCGGFEAAQPILIKDHCFLHDEQAVSAVLLHNLGVVHFERGMLNVAEQLFNMVVSMKCVQPKNEAAKVSTHYMLGLIHVLQGKQEEATVELMTALHMKSDSMSGNSEVQSWVLERVGRFLISRGFINEVFETFDVTLSINTDDEAKCSIALNSELVQ